MLLQLPLKVQARARLTGQLLQVPDNLGVGGGVVRGVVRKDIQVQVRLSVSPTPTRLTVSGSNSLSS